MVPLAALFAVIQAGRRGPAARRVDAPHDRPVAAHGARSGVLVHRSPPALDLLLGLALVWVIAVGVVGSVAPPADPAPWYGKVFQVVTMATGHVPDHHPLHALPGTTPTGGPPGARGVPEVSRGRPLEDDADAGGIARSADATATILGAAETPPASVARRGRGPGAPRGDLPRGEPALRAPRDLFDAESLQASVVEPLAEPADVGEVVRDAVASLEIPMGWTCASISSPPTRRSTAPGWDGSSRTS